ncbi:hypothetical protein HPB49_004173 [Dermacentor silvarum]|uniref:Uncharacterized protein n=1 Tax=Dermacentor silvarum TaxID=543639 RepID=A0ACB8CPS4_DERSI|nr:hypothetical protein HPB49_004173 [Dermacentor silvarum]
MKELRKEFQGLVKRNGLTGENLKLSNRVEELEQHQRSNNLEMKGVPTKDATEFVKKIGVFLGEPLVDADIDASRHSNCSLDVARSPTDMESTVEGELVSEEEWSDDSWKSHGYIAQE